jgi:hypothetical protein
MTQQRSIITAEQTQKLVNATLAAGGTEWGAILILVTLIKFFAQTDSLKAAAAIQLVRLAMFLDPHCEHVSWNSFSEHSFEAPNKPRLLLYEAARGLLSQD